jgi:FKBP-type peptidyl-prolyl cis-trans isomerase
MWIDLRKIRFFNFYIICAGIFIFPLLISSCKNSSSKADEDTPMISTDSLISLNRELVRKDMKKIEDYIGSSGMEMKQSGTGMFYSIVRDKGSQKARPGDEAVFTYIIRDLEGDLIYSSEDLGLKKFEVDRSYVESGWNEAAKLMGMGDSAVVILPPHLAFRNLGDGNKIGAGETLVYELRMDSVR